MEKSFECVIKSHQEEFFAKCLKNAFIYLSGDNIFANG